MGKICYQCGNEMQENAKFCSKCGSEIVQTPIRKKRSKKKLVVIVVVLLLALVIFMQGETDDSGKTINKEDFKQRFCDNLDIEYDQNQWREDGDSEAYESDGLMVVINIDVENGEVITAGFTNDMHQSVTNRLIYGVDNSDEIFMWKCYLVSAMLDCDIKTADSIVRKANKSSSDWTEVDNIIVKPSVDTGYDNLELFQVININYMDKD